MSENAQISPVQQKQRLPARNGLLIVNSDCKNVVPKKELHRIYQKHIQLHVPMVGRREKCVQIA